MKAHLGIDVSAKTLVVARRTSSGATRQRRFPNTASGHQKLVDWAADLSDDVRVCLEATGIYSLDLALALDAAPGVEVSVVNPRAARNFAKALMTRGKDDPADAAVLLRYSEAMEFRAYERPSIAVLELRGVSRRIGALTRSVAAEKNRKHAAEQTSSTPAFVIEDIAQSIDAIAARIRRLSDHTLGIARADEVLWPRFQLLVTITGVAQTSALRLLAELSALPADMTVRQWVAHAGLDPRPWRSGTSVHGLTRISKTGNERLRTALYMPALVAIRHDPNVAAYYHHLLERGKRPKQATVAVMRKLLHAIHGMFKHGTAWDGSRFYAGPNGPGMAPQEPEDADLTQTIWALTEADGPGAAVSQAKGLGDPAAKTGATGSLSEQSPEIDLDSQVSI